MKTKLMIALFSTLLLGACQNSQMGMDNKDMKETTEMMSSMSGEKMDKMDNMSSNGRYDTVYLYNIRWERSFISRL